MSRANFLITMKTINYNIPLLCVGTVSTAAGLTYVMEKQSPVDAIELRVDALLHNGISVDMIESTLKQQQQPVILTLRTAEEGGVHAWQGQQRLSTFLRLLPLATGIDIELASIPELQLVYNQAKKLSTLIILSAHSIDRAPNPLQLRRWVRAFAHYRATFYKIAVRINPQHAQHDLQQLAHILLTHPEKRWALMGLGPMATFSREVLTGIGSRLVYGYLDKPAAAGQPSVAEIVKLRDIINGK